MQGVSLLLPGFVQSEDIPYVPDIYTVNEYVTFLTVESHVLSIKNCLLVATFTFLKKVV